MASERLQMTHDEYNRLIMERSRVFGFGMETSFSAPCPFCCAPDWMTYKVLEVEEVMKRGAVCKDCGRGVRAVFSVDQPGHKQFEFVQTCGPDPDLPFLPPMRRVE